MDSLSFLNTIPFSSALKPPPPRSKPHPLHPKLIPLSAPFSTLTPPGALKSPRGFGPPTSKRAKTRKKTQTNKDDDDDDEDEDDVAIPEVVTNRMMKRMGLSVGIPLSVGLLFFPFFYYLKVVARVDVPSWVPFVVSFVFFGTALESATGSCRRAGTRCGRGRCSGGMRPGGTGPCSGSPSGVVEGEGRSDDDIH
ncbi:uncharacterized protein A4U43_C10F600 [Asparagus officinalis]|uniref:Protein PAM68, chloroplastic n=1 Tax=Asparagus officinalis TaxID=4686 RepID=A0A5P1E033_ASPOF|nr:uncharacterized protein A4U43_C10F600 [Asparagus officinalis]